MALWPPAGIVELTIFSGSLYAGCFLPALLCALWTRAQPGAAVWLSIACGALVVALWRQWPMAGNVHEVFPAIAASAVVLLAGCRPVPRAAS